MRYMEYVRISAETRTVIRRDVMPLLYAAGERRVVGMYLRPEEITPEVESSIVLRQWQWV